MAEKYIELEEVVHSETDPIVHVWSFSCSLCKAVRTVYLHESGVVLDVKDGQPADVEGLVVASDGQTFLNLYLIENAKARLEIQGTILINQDIADLHAQSFHGLPGASVGLAN
mgnify:FL=1